MDIKEILSFIETKKIDINEKCTFMQLQKILKL